LYLDKSLRKSCAGGRSRENRKLKLPWQAIASHDALLVLLALFSLCLPSRHLTATGAQALARKQDLAYRDEGDPAPDELLAHKAQISEAARARAAVHGKGDINVAHCAKIGLFSHDHSTKLFQMKRNHFRWVVGCKADVLRAVAFVLELDPDVRFAGAVAPARACAFRLFSTNRKAAKQRMGTGHVYALGERARKGYLWAQEDGDDGERKHYSGLAWA